MASNPRGMYQRSGKWHVRYLVPTKWRQLLGRAQITKSTGMSDVHEAMKRQHGLMAALIAEVESAAMLKLNPPATRMADPDVLVSITGDLLRQVAAGELEYDTAMEILAGAQEEHVAALGLGPEDVHGEDLMRLRRTSKALRDGAPLVLLKDAFNEYLTDSEGRMLKSSWATQQTVLTEFAEWAKNRPISDVTMPLALAYVDTVMKPKGRAFRTNSTHLSALQSAFKFAKRRSYTNLNPWTEMIEEFRESKRGDASKSTKRRPWSQAELDCLKTLDQDDVGFQVSMLCLHHGMRTDEAASLKVEDINIDERFIAVTKGKSKSSVRQLPASDACLPMLTRLVKDRDGKENLFSTLQPGGTDGTLAHNLSKRMGRWIRKHVSKDKALVWYGLRHTAITKMEEAGLSELLCQRVTGHSPQKITWSIYSAASGLEAMRPVIDSLDFGFDTA